jgi:isopentenyl-diphosphate delta-isomerase
MEEMGIETEIEKVFDFIYAADLENGLKEYEFDHVYAGLYDGPVHANPEEVHDFCYKDVNEISQSLLTHPKKYTVWFHIAFPKVEQWWNKRFKAVSS